MDTTYLLCSLLFTSCFPHFWLSYLRRQAPSNRSTTGIALSVAPAVNHATTAPCRYQSSPKISCQVSHEFASRHDHPKFRSSSATVMPSLTSLLVPFEYPHSCLSTRCDWSHCQDVRNFRNPPSKIIAIFRPASTVTLPTTTLVVTAALSAINPNRCYRQWGCYSPVPELHPFLGCKRVWTRSTSLGHYVDLPRLGGLTSVLGDSSFKCTLQWMLT